MATLTFAERDDRLSAALNPADIGRMLVPSAVLKLLAFFNEEADRRCDHADNDLCGRNARVGCIPAATKRGCGLLSVVRPVL
jgi:hypothetical protein